MFLTDFRTRKYTGDIISRVGIFLTVTPDQRNHNCKIRKRMRIFFFNLDTDIKFTVSVIPLIYLLD